MGNQVLEEKILKVDKSKWKLTKLGTLAEDISVRVDKPGNSEYDRFVGLDNFISGDIKIKSWASTKNLTSSAKAFKAGDILFARRNAYLRRASLVDFDGCCSGDAFVIRENLNNVVPGYLAFLMNTNALWDYANSNAAGTMSKRVKWRDLAEYEFLLPPKAEQTRLVELLLEIDNVIEKERELLERTKRFEEIKVKAIFSGEKNSSKSETKLGFIDSSWECIKLQELLDRKIIISHLDGNHGSYYPKNEEFVKTGVPYISANCIVDDGISFENAKYLTEERSNQITKGVAKSGDILLAHNATVGPVCKLECSYEKVILSTTLTYYRVNEKLLNSTYLFYFMKSRLFQAQIERVMSQSTRNQVPITTQRNLYFIIPPFNIQKKLTDKLVEISKISKMAESKISTSQALQKSLINQIF